MQFIQRSNLRRASILLCLFILVILVALLSSACFLVSESGEDYGATRVAIQVQQTILSRDQAELTRDALASLAEGGEPEQLETVDPIGTLPATETPNLPEVLPTATSTPQIDELDERTLKSARILLFEDMSASGQIRLVKEALDQADYFYLDVGSAKGWFKTQLSSPQEWDLIIAAAEADRNFGGEYFEFIRERIDQGASAIIEYRDLDSAPSGMSKPLLDSCGVRFQSDWFEPDLRVFYVLEPEHPIFNQPNPITHFRNAPQIWSGDVGDLVEIKYKDGKPAGDAKLLISTNTFWKTDHGLLVNCIDGRLTMQLFASHEYQYSDVVPMWQNYIYQALKSRFRVAPPPAPTPAITVAPTPTSEIVPTVVEDELLVDPLGTYTCGNLLDARLTRSPHYQKQLFEHNAVGNFMILRLELVNRTEFPIQIWDDDYAIEGLVYDKKVVYTPDVPATGYLYIEGGGKLYQDRIEPGAVWRTQLVFDVDPRGNDFDLIIRPGSKFNEQVCEVRIPMH